MYVRCLQTEPRHPFALYNVAVLMEELGRDNDVVLTHYERAAQADRNDATTLADYGRYIALILI